MVSVLRNKAVCYGSRWLGEGGTIFRWQNEEDVTELVKVILPTLPI